MRSLNYKTRFIELASEINAEMPIFVVDKVRDALNRNKKAVNGSHILVLGVAYKRDIDDVRESPALDVIRLLEADGAHVDYHDPHVHSINENGKVLESVKLTDSVLRDADAVVIVTDHKAFDYDKIVKRSRVLIDARHVVPRTGKESGASWIVKS
jgi:UDP-N-acetyl-D-glucosamine dehydrogenase